MSSVTPVGVWGKWITKIASDPEMDLDRLMRHLQLHVGSHMPNADAPPERWVRWMAGTYNLMGILSGMLQVEPSHAQGIARLFRHWQTAPTDHTPPPAGLMSACRAITSTDK